MADAPSYQDKKYIELNDPGMFDYLASQVPDDKRGLTLQQIAQNGKIYGVGGDAVNIAKSLANKGLGDLQAGDVISGKNSPGFIEQYGLGKAYSLADYVKRYSSSNPNFDPNDQTAINSIAQQIQARGIDPLKDKEGLQTFITNASINSSIDKAQNPGKYLSPDQTAQNQQTAQQLVGQIYGPDSAQDPHLVDFISQQLAQGVHPYELSQFLQTTPQYLEAKAAKDREALNQELLGSEDQVFKQFTPQIISSYLKAGRVNSSGLDSAITNARAQLAQQRQGVLTGYAREDAVNARNSAFQNYIRQSDPTYQQRYAVQNASNYANFQQPYNALSRQYSLNDEARQRQYQIDDYNRMQSDFLRYMSQGGNGTQGAFRGALSGAGAGASFGPWGALLGAGLGALGGYEAYK
jgi:hypothetical protein